MNIYDLIPSISTILFILIAFYYWRSIHKFYFLLISFSDIISVIMMAIFSFSAQSLWIPIDYLLLFSVDKNVLVKWKYYILIGLLPTLTLNYYSTSYMQYIFGLTVNIILLFIFLRYFIKKYYRSGDLDLFYIAMILFEINIIVRLLAIIKGVELGVNIFFAALIMQIIIGIFLIIIRKGAVIKLKS